MNESINDLIIQLTNSRGNLSSISIQNSIDNLLNNLPNHLFDTFDLDTSDRIILNNVHTALSDVININSFININDNDYEYYNSVIDSDNESDSENFPVINYDRLIDVPVVMSLKEFNGSFKRKTVTNRYHKILNQNNCSICLEGYALKDVYITLYCKHNFHEKCIKKWLCENSTKCPSCRMPQK